MNLTPLQEQELVERFIFCLGINLSSSGKDIHQLMLQYIAAFESEISGDLPRDPTPEPTLEQLFPNGICYG